MRIDENIISCLKGVLKDVYDAIPGSSAESLSITYFLSVYLSFTSWASLLKLILC